ncbi:unnamed protein product [Gadus morhua 'NCC']
MDSSAVTLTEVDVGPLRDTRFAVLVNTSVKEEQQIKTQSAFTVLMEHSQMAHHRLVRTTQNVNLWD